MSIPPKATGTIQKSGSGAASAGSIENRALAILMGPDMQARLQSLMTDKSMLDRYIAVVTGIVKSTPLLAQCSPESLIGCMLKSAFLKLEPNNPITQECWFIPRKIKGVWTCNWESGWKGLIKLARRSDQVTGVFADKVYERDVFDIDFGKREIIHKLPETDKMNRGKLIGYWAKWEGTDPSMRDVRFMSVDDMDAHVDAFVTSNKGEGAAYSPWTKSYDEMALKTIVKKVLKTAPMSVEDYAHAIENEGNVVTDPKFQLPGAKFAFQPTTCDLLSAPHTEFLEVDYENQPETAGSDSPEASAPVEQKVSTEEHQRLEILDKIEKKIVEKKLAADVVTEKAGMPISMIERAALPELVRIYKVLS